MAEIMASALTPTLWHFSRETGKVFFRSIKWDVRSSVGEVEKEGLFRVALDECQGCLATCIEVVESVVHLLHLDSFTVECVIGETRAVSILRIDIVESVLRDFVGRAEMPFPDLTGSVSGFLEAFRDRGLLVKALERIAIAF
jgi:hypothetical protein